MKQTINIIAFFFVLSIPFALSSQTRKAIPAGRYEALSGIKNSRASKINETVTSTDKKEAVTLFWTEVLSHIPEKSTNLNFFSIGKLEEFESSSLKSKGLAFASQIGQKTKLVYSDNLKRDEGALKSLKNKDSLIVLKDNRELKEVMGLLSQFEVLLYQAESQTNYFLLKLK